MIKGYSPRIVDMIFLFHLNRFFVDKRRLLGIYPQANGLFRDISKSS